MLPASVARRPVVTGCHGGRNYRCPSRRLPGSAIVIVAILITGWWKTVNRKPRKWNVKIREINPVWFIMYVHLTPHTRSAPPPGSCRRVHYFTVWFGYWFGYPVQKVWLLFAIIAYGGLVVLLLIGVSLCWARAGSTCGSVLTVAAAAAAVVVVL